MAPPTKIAKTKRYFDPEITKVYFLTTIVAADFAPTRAEITAGKDLTDEIADLSGWTVTSEQIETPDLGSRFTKKIGGRTTAEDSSLTFYADENGDDVRTVLARSTRGFIVWCDGGDIEDNIAAVFPVQVLSNSQQRSVSGDAARRIVQFSITDEPNEAVELPAAA